MENNMVLI